MINNLGIFINNTDSEIKIKININNYNKLKNNFDHIIIIDIDNVFSKKLNENFIDNKNVIKYIINNNYKKKNINYLDLNLFNDIFMVLNDIKLIDYNYITFIDDNYIYCNDLKDYFMYMKIHNLDFTSYSDSSENEYHYELYLFSIKSLLIDKLKNLFNTNNSIDNKNNLLYKIHNTFNIKMPFLKIAYLKNNINNNIFYNINKYKELVFSNLLPIINIDYILTIINDFKYKIYDKLPSNFNINIYRQNDDLKNYSDLELEKHFLENGQFELRNYTNELFILPSFIRKLLKQSNLLESFDVPDNFNVFKYFEKNNDLKKLNIKELLIHWIEYGNNELRVYF